jgi:hypothetical protein
MRRVAASVEGECFDQIISTPLNQNERHAFEKSRFFQGLENKRLAGSSGFQGLEKSGKKFRGLELFRERVV